MDSRKRKAQRAASMGFEESCLYVSLLLRNGDISVWDVETSAALGNPIALALFPGTKQIKWKNWDTKRNLYQELINQDRSRFVALVSCELAVDL